MIRGLLLVVAFGMQAACATWQPHGRSEVRASADGHVLVVSKDQALELDDARAESDEIRGKPIARWTFGAIDQPALDYLQHTNDSPTDIAQKLSWQTASTSEELSRVPLADVLVLRSYDPRAGLTALAVFGGLAALIVIGLGILVEVAIHASCGRPLRVRGRQVVTCLARRGEAAGWTDPIALAPVPEAARRVLAEVWALEARGEHAAVAAFSKTALELMALGAPPDLVVRANRAAIQEVEHARLCFAVASAYSGQNLAPAPLPEALAGDTPDLLRLACESLVDGCLREGLASQIAAAGAQSALDPQIARVLRVQAKEEAQHAAFSWDIVEWALQRGGERMRRRLLAQVERLEFPRCDDLPEHGRVGRAVVEPLFDQIRSDARARLAALRDQPAAGRPPIQRESVIGEVRT